MSRHSLFRASPADVTHPLTQWIAHKFRPSRKGRKRPAPTPVRYRPLVDGSKYPGGALRAIRSRKVNYRGEVQR